MTSESPPRRGPVQILFGFHAVGMRLKTHPDTVIEVWVDPQRRDARMKMLLDRVRDAGKAVSESDERGLTRMAGVDRHQGVVARVSPVVRSHSLDDLLDAADSEGRGPSLVLALDGVTDPHNLGACLRTGDAVGVHAVIAPKDHAVGVNATVAKVASGAADTVPYLMVTNLARTLGELKERGVRVIGTSDDATQTLYDLDLRGPVALVLGAEGKGMRQLVRNTCDDLVAIPMRGAVESLNVSVAAAVCLYEVLRQRRS